MKQIILITVILMSIWTSAVACDVCGTSLGSSLGVSLQNNRHFFGVKYQFSEYFRVGNSKGQYYDISEQYRNVELLGRYVINKRFQIVGQLPYSFDQLNWDEGDMKRRGIGDAKVQFQANIWCNAMEKKRKWKSDLWLGIGVKAPLGEYNEVHNELNETFTFLNGTGSWDFFSTLNYSLKYKAFGWNTELSYQYNTENSNQYRFGNRTSVMSRLFYAQKVKSTILVPFAGIGFEKSKNVSLNGFEFGASGGQASLMEFGAQIYLKNIMIGCSFYQPILENNTILEANVGQRIVLNSNLFF